MEILELRNITTKTQWMDLAQHHMGLIKERISELENRIRENTPSEQQRESRLGWGWGNKSLMDMLDGLQQKI